MVSKTYNNDLHAVLSSFTCVRYCVPCFVYVSFNLDNNSELGMLFLFCRWVHWSPEDRCVLWKETKKANQDRILRPPVLWQTICLHFPLSMLLDWKETSSSPEYVLPTIPSQMENPWKSQYKRNDIRCPRSCFIDLWVWLGHMYFAKSPLVILMCTSS